MSLKNDYSEWSARVRNIFGGKDYLLVQLLSLIDYRLVRGWSRLARKLHNRPGRNRALLWSGTHECSRHGHYSRFGQGFNPALFKTHML